MTDPQCHRVSLWLSQNLNLDLAGSTVSLLSPVPCCAFMSPSAWGALAVPYRKKSTSCCDVSGCPHLDDILPRALSSWPINITNARHPQWDHMVPGSPELCCPLQRRPYSLLAFVTSLPPKVMPLPKYQCPFYTFKPQLVSLMKIK